MYDPVKMRKFAEAMQKPGTTPWKAAVAAGVHPDNLRQAANEWPYDQFVLDYIKELNAPGKVNNPEQVVTYLDQLRAEFNSTPSSLARVALLKEIGKEEAKKNGAGFEPERDKYGRVIVRDGDGKDVWVQNALTKQLERAVAYDQYGKLAINRKAFILSGHADDGRRTGRMGTQGIRPASPVGQRRCYDRNQERQ